MNQKNIFISYSRNDSAFVDQLISDLTEAGFNLWRDKDNLKPGTPSWERAIREAIKEAGAIVLVASPASLNSDYVQGELALAKIYHCPIYPIWGDGDQWIESAPLDMVNYQYVDGRGEGYVNAVKQLTDTLRKIFDQSDGIIRLGLPTHEIVELNLAQFETGFNILSYIWASYLQDWYEASSYGVEWVIGNVETKQIAMPWQWLTIDSSDPQVISELYMLSGSISYIEFGIRDNSYWAVWDARRLKATGLFLNDAELVRNILSPNGLSEMQIRLQRGTLVRQPLDEIAPNFYKYRIVIAALDRADDRLAIVER
jgi:hypothetical protein